MSTKLTLTINQSIIDKAKSYAKEKNRSLSDIIENYLKIITQEPKVPSKSSHHPIVSGLMGSFKTDQLLDYDKILQDRREKKLL